MIPKSKYYWKFLFCLYSILSILLICATACTTNEDCSLNGVCGGDGKCSCDPGWISADCGALDLQPATKNTGYNKTGSGTSSWCNHIIHDPDDPSLYHLIVSEFQNKCGIDYWSPFSRIIRAESRTGPEGPYNFAQEVAPSFAHNPSVVYSASEKLYLVYGIGCPTTLPSSCQGPNFTCGPGNTINGESGIAVWSSPDLKNWTSHGQVFSGDDTKNWDADVTNPSPLMIHSPSGDSVILAYRGCPENCANDPNSEMINLAAALHFTGPYVKLGKDPIFTNPNEDPFIWRDFRGNYHMLFHSFEAGGGFGGPNVGRHAFSRSPVGPWTFNNNTLAFTTGVDFTDGTHIDYWRRERPNLFFSEDGKMTPLFLSNGVQEVNNPQSYSLIQPIGRAGRRAEYTAANDEEVISI